MGSIVAIIGESGDPELPLRLQRMLTRSAYRGRPQHLVEHGFAVGIQARFGEASLAKVGNWIVAVHGYVGNWAEGGFSVGEDVAADASDAARIAAAYERLGRSLFATLRGEFSILVYDRSNRSVLAVRDVPGGRPLVHLAAEGRSYLATEIRQLHAGAGVRPEIDDDGLIQDLMWSYADRERTHFRGVSRVLPGRLAWIDTVGEDRPFRYELYWRPPPESRGSYDTGELTEELREILDRSLDRCLPSHPFGVCLSGGLDSSSLFCLVAHRARHGDARAALGHPFSFVFPGIDSDESRRIRLIHEATGVDGTLVDGSDVFFSDSLEELARDIDGLHLGSLFLLELIAREMERDGRTAALLGVGGDEWLFGSLSYLAEELFTGRVLSFVRDLFRYQLDPGVRRRNFVFTYTAYAAWARVARRRAGGTSRPRWLHPDRPVPVDDRTRCISELDDTGSIGRSRRGVLGTLLMVQDLHQRDTEEQLFARHGLDQRLPLMDLDLIEFAFRTPGRAITDGLRDKHLLRSAVAELLPDEIRDGLAKVHYATAISRDINSIGRSVPPGAWRLVERKLVNKDVVTSYFSQAEHALEARRVLPSLIVAEYVLRENT